MQKSPLCIFFPLIPFNLQKIRANSSLSRLFAPFPTSIPTPSALIVPFLFFVQDYTRILKKHPVILVTTYLKPEEVRKANMIPASTPDEALEIAYQMKGRDASVVVIPDGVSVLAVKE